MLSHQRDTFTAKSSTGPSLSVVLVSSGKASETAQATRVLRDASRDIEAQLIVVSPAGDAKLADLVKESGAEFVTAPPGSSRALMCDLGMKRASGHIVAVRDDLSVGDGRWLDTYRLVLARHGRVGPAMSRESVVMDSLATQGRTALADAPAARTHLDQVAAPIEVASAV